MIQRSTRRGVLLIATGGLLAACGETGSDGNPDPGNRRLHALATDAIFASLPRGGTRTIWQEKPAYRSSSVFEGRGWHGPSVVMTFTSSESIRDVYGFFAKRAQETGWTPTPGKKSSSGLIWAWSKHIAEKESFLILHDDFDSQSADVDESGIPRSYRLSGGA
jgi:hypothetical protein